jgi:hypothetical protein
MGVTLSKGAPPDVLDLDDVEVEDDGKSPLYVANPRTVRDGGSICVVGDLGLTFAPQGATYDDAVRVIPREAAEGSMDLQKALAIGQLVQIDKATMKAMFGNQKVQRDQADAEAMEGVVFEGNITGEELEVDPEVLQYSDQYNDIMSRGGEAIPSDRSDSPSRRAAPQGGRRLAPDPGAKTIGPKDGIDGSQIVGDVVQ